MFGRTYIVSTWKAGFSFIYKLWDSSGLSGPFYKAVCKVNPKEFENAKLIEDHVIITESSLNNQEIAIAFKPREEWPKMFKFLGLHKEA